MPSDEEVSRGSRAVGAAIEPFSGSVYFSPECHTAYEALGFSPSPHTTKDGVALPDGAAYFVSRGSLLGQVPGEVIAATFGVFNPAVVVPEVARGWAITDAPTIEAARTEGAFAQLRRLLGPQPSGVDRVVELLTRAGERLSPAGKPLYAGVVAQGLPGEPLADAWRLADRLREYRGDAHIAAWTVAGLDGAEVGLLTDLWWSLPFRSYVRTRAWSADDLDAATARLQQRGLLDGESLSSAGRTLREEVELATDRQCRPIVEALGDGLDELVERVGDWSAAVKEARGYPPSGPQDLAPAR